MLCRKGCLCKTLAYGRRPQWSAVGDCGSLQNKGINDDLSEEIRRACQLIS